MWQDLSQNIQAKLIEFGSALSFAPPWAVSIILFLSAIIVAAAQ